MAEMQRTFAGYTESEAGPNIVVDGSPNRSTVLTLTHWPGIDQPSGLADDLSAQMAFRYLDGPVPHPPATVVTNNHFDQDGVVSVFALVRPDDALAHRELLVDVAAAGDFATYRHRDAARASMALWSYASSELSPLAGQLTGLDEADQCSLLYHETLPLLIPMITQPERFRDLWAAEDERLTASEEAIASGEVTIGERPDVDLAVITVPAGTPRRPGHRFGTGGLQFRPIHPMAINNATRCVRQLVVHGRAYRYVDRYETWVQYRTRRLARRVDLAPLADRLTALETGPGRWRSTPPSALTPLLSSDDESSLDPDTVVAEVVHHLATAPPAWDPYRTRSLA